MIRSLCGRKESAEVGENMKEASLSLAMIITGLRSAQTSEGESGATDDFIMGKIKADIAALLLPDDNDAQKVRIVIAEDGYSVTVTGPEEIIEKIKKAPNKHRLVKRLKWETSDFIN